MRYILLLLLLIGLAGCGGDELASVSDRSIKKGEFDAYLKIKQVRSADEKRRDALLAKFLEREALAAAIEKSELLDRAVIGAEINEFRKDILISRYFDQFLKEKVSDEAVRSYYNDHIQDFSEEQIHAAHILVRTHPMMTEEQLAKRLSEAKAILGKIKEGKPFAEMAKASSQDKVTAGKGGDMGWVKAGALDQRFSKAVFELKPGEISDPVKTSFGYHLITVLEATRTSKRPLEVVDGQIRRKLRNEAKTAEYERLLASVKVKQ